MLGRDAAALGTLIIVTERLEPAELLARLRGCDRCLSERVGVAALPGGGGIVLKVIAASATEAELTLADAASLLDCAHTHERRHGAEERRRRRLRLIQALNNCTAPADHHREGLPTLTGTGYRH